VYNRDPFVAIDGVAAQLRRLQTKGLRLGIVSNANGQMEAELLRHRICSRDGHDCAEVDVVIDSELVGIEKPDPAIFGLALDALGLPPSAASTSETPSISTSRTRRPPASMLYTSRPSESAEPMTMPTSPQCTISSTVWSDSPS
jgi:hypothetical protein